MKVFLIDNNRVSKYMFPSRVDDTFLISYNNGNKDILITLEGKDNNWFLKSNGTVDIIENNNVISELKVNLYDRYNLDKEKDILKIFDGIGKKIGAMKNNEIDYDKVYDRIIRDTR